MSWLLERIRLRREQAHQQKLRRLQKLQWKRIQQIEEKYKELNFFGIPQSAAQQTESGFIPDMREKYMLYFLNRVGIFFIPEEAYVLARACGPAMAAERVCRWLGLDYHKIAAVAPRVASETLRATMYLKEMQQSCEVTGISPDALLPHIHFGSHDTRDILYERFRTASRIIRIYDVLPQTLKDHVGWEANRNLFVNEWKDVNSDCLVRFYEQGILLAEYQRRIEVCGRLLDECSRSDPELLETWLSSEGLEKWQDRYPDFDTIVILVHLSNIIRDVDRNSSVGLNRVLKKMYETNFDFRVWVGDSVEK